MADIEHEVVVQVTGYDAEMGLYCNTCGVHKNDIWQSEVSIPDITKEAIKLVHKEPDPSIVKIGGEIVYDSTV